METPPCKFYPQHGSSDAWHGKERRRAHRISLGVPNTIFYWLPLYRGTQSSIFSLPPSLSLSSCNIYLAFSLSPSTLSSEGFSVRLSVSASTFIDTLQNCTGVRSPIRLHFITSFFTSPFSLSLFERLSLRLRQHVAWSAVPIPIGSIISD